MNFDETNQSFEIESLLSLLCEEFEKSRNNVTYEYTYTLTEKEVSHDKPITTNNPCTNSHSVSLILLLCVNFKIFRFRSATTLTEMRRSVKMKFTFNDASFTLRNYVEINKWTNQSFEIERTKLNKQILKKRIHLSTDCEKQESHYRSEG